MTQHLGGRRFTKKKVGLKQSRTFRGIVLGVVPVFGLAFSAAFLASSIFAPINTSNAAETVVTANVTYGAYSLSLSTESSVTLNLVADVDGAMAVTQSNVSTSTSSPGGYKLFLSMVDTAPNNYLVHTLDANKKITSSGTFTNPVALTNGTWGYAIPHSTATVLNTNGFDASYTAQTSGSTNSSTFAAVPVGEPIKIAQTSTSNSTPNVIPVYYGARVGFETASGSYTNTVLYTAVADAGSSAALYVSPDETPAIDGGEVLTLTTTLVSTATDIDADVYLLTASQYAAVTAAQNPTDVRTLTSAKLTYGQNDSCQRVSGVDVLQLQCDAPAKDPGNYYLYVNVPDYGLHYDKPFSYVKNFYNISTMQEMTANICNDTKYVVTPKATIINGTNIYGQSNTATAQTNADTGNALHRPNHPNDPNYVPQVELEDTRQTNINGSMTTVSYTVRKLADGNCWMTENLQLNWNANRQFTSADTNVTSTVTVADKTQATTATGGDATTDEADTWKEPSGDGSSPNRWLSRSTNGATENSYSAAAVQTGENQPLGTYYNWYTAVMGTVTGQAEATQDICPKGWRLPKYDAVSGSFMYLIRDVYHIIQTAGDQSTVSGGNLAANNTLHGFPLSLPYSGYVGRTVGSTVDRGAYGYFWSAGANSATTSRALAFRGSYVGPEGDGYKTYGFSVRCFAKQS